MREKLINLLEEIAQKTDDERCKKCVEQNCVRCAYENIADHLIANGVTIDKDNNVPSKWIPVTERLPEKDVLVLCIGARGGMFLGRSPSLFSDGTAYFVVPNARSCRYATYWMPL